MNNEHSHMHMLLHCSTHCPVQVPIPIRTCHSGQSALMKPSLMQLHELRTGPRRSSIDRTAHITPERTCHCYSTHLLYQATSSTGSGGPQRSPATRGAHMSQPGSDVLVESRQS